MKESYNRILVPFDGSKHSQMALRIAANFAIAFKSTLYIVNVIDISQVNSTGRIYSTGTRKKLDEIIKSARITAESQIHKIESEYQTSGITTNSVVLEGSVSETLLRFTKAHSIDLIVIGSRGLSRFSKIMALGSVSRKISELSDCPVLIVR